MNKVDPGKASMSLIKQDIVVSVFENKAKKRAGSGCRGVEGRPQHNKSGPRQSEYVIDKIRHSGLGF
jgi:hypothetical protein